MKLLSDMTKDLNNDVVNMVGSTGVMKTAPLVIPTAGKWVPAKQEKDVFSYNTTVVLNAPMSKVLAALQGDWNLWWAGGEARNRKGDGMGGWTWDLSPIKMGPLAPINVGVHAWKPVTNSDGTVYIRVNLGAMSDNNGGNFAGLAGFMLWPNDDKTVLRSFWVKMAPKGIAIVMGPLALTAHFSAEDNALKNLDNYLNKKPILSIPRASLSTLLDKLKSFLPK